MLQFEKRKSSVKSLWHNFLRKLMRNQNISTIFIGRLLGCDNCTHKIYPPIFPQLYAKSNYIMDALLSNFPLNHRLKYCKSDGVISRIWSNSIHPIKTLPWPDLNLEPHAYHVSALPTLPRGFCWKWCLCLVTCSMHMYIYFQISEELRLNRDISSNLTICNLHFAEAALRFFIHPPWKCP